MKLHNLLVIILLTGCASPDSEPISCTFDSLANKTASFLKTHTDSAHRLSEELVTLAARSRQESMIYKASLLRGKAFQAAKMNDSALRYFRMMSATAFHMKDTLNMLETCNILGFLYHEMGASDSVRRWFNTGLVLARSSGNENYLAGFSANMGLYYSQNGQADSAMMSYSKAAHYYEAKADSANLAQVHRNIGNLFFHQGMYQEANSHYRKSARINQEQGHFLELATDLTNLAVSMNLTGSDSTIYFYQEAMRILSGHGGPANLLPVQFNYANYLKDRGRYTEAELAYRNVLETSRKNRILQGEMYSLIQLGEIELLRNNLKKGNIHFREAIRIAIENKQINDLVTFYHEAFKSNLEAKNIDQALAFFLKWEKLNDSLNTRLHREALLKYKTMYESQVMQSKVNELNDQLKIKRSQTVNIILASAILIILVTASALLQSYRKRQAKQKQLIAEQSRIQTEQENLLREAELEKVNLETKVQTEKLAQVMLELRIRDQELIYQTLLRADQSQLNRSIQERLRPFYPLFSRRKTQEEFLLALQEIGRESGRNPLEDFELLFKQSHGRFFEILLLRCSDLTRNELLVAAMLRLNLPSKEIARLMNVLPSTIDTTRHHLRRKLGICPKESLLAYLHAIRD